MTQTIERITANPNDLLVDVNIRHDTRVDQDFLASIKELGVIVPITAVRTASGELRVRHGHRRTQAAVEGGLDSVPVEVIGDDSDARADHIDRIVRQYAENEHRAGLTSAEKVDVVTQLSAFGVKASEITKKTRIPKAEVKQATEVAKSDVAKVVTAKYDLSLEQAATVAEFEDDKEAVKALVVTARQEPEQFPHKVEELRYERQARKVAEPTIEEFRERGVTVLDAEPEYADAAIVPLRRLNNYKGISAEAHADCPGHAVYVDAYVYEDDRDAEDPEWHVDVDCYCTQPDLHKDEKPSDRRSTTDAANDAAAAKVREKASQERKRILEGNAKWRAAEKVRRDWLRGLINGKKAPEGAQQFIAAELFVGGYMVRKALDQGNRFAIDLFELRDPDSTTDAQALLITLGIVVGALENDLGTHTWRSKDDKRAAAYLSQLAEWGYGLSPIEQGVIDAASKGRR